MQQLNQVSVNQIVTLAEGVVPGDFDSDGNVDGGDFLAWQRGESPTAYSASDLSDWKANFPTPPPSSAAAAPVPEPAATRAINPRS